MRDFRDAKAMAHVLRTALADNGLKITVSQSLELIAKLFGVADWNTLAAAIRAEVHPPRNDSFPPPHPSAKSVRALPFSAELLAALHRASAHADCRKHKWTTLEHLLLALVDDVDASEVMKVCDVDLGALKDNLVGYIDNKLKTITRVTDDGGETRPTAGFQRAVQRAMIHAQELGRPAVTGAELLVGIFPETESPAAHLLSEQHMTREGAVNFIVRGIAKGSGDAAV